MSVVAPNGARLQGTFGPGEVPSLDLAELSDGLPLLDGAYKYALHSMAGSDSSDRRTEEAVVRSRFGALRLRGGAPEVDVRLERSGSEGEVHSVRSEVVNDSAATPSIHLEDTTPEGTGTETDWGWSVDFPQAGDGDSDYAIYSTEESSSPSVTRFPFVIENGAPDNALYLENSGDLGLGTNAPLSDLHIVGGIPDIRFEGGGTDWRVIADSIAFEVTNLSDGFTPLRILPSAGSGLLRLAAGGVGINSSNPQGDLHIGGPPTSDIFSGIGPDLISGPAFNFGYSGASFGVGSGFFNVRPTGSAVAPNPALYFATRNIERMMIDRDGQIAVHMDSTFANTFDPLHPIHAQVSGAHLSGAGVWTNASSRALKENIVPLTAEVAFSALQALEPVQYNYRVEPNDPQVGFIAEDVPELVATPDRATLAPTDIVGVLTKVLQEQQSEIETLRRLMEVSERRLGALEAQLQGAHEPR
ncbi:MAG: tail fiber domain-containing protein [Acidobacteriota bacterium]